MISYLHCNLGNSVIFVCDTLEFSWLVKLKYFIKIENWTSFINISIKDDSTIMILKWLLGKVFSNSDSEIRKISNNIICKYNDFLEKIDLSHLLCYFLPLWFSTRSLEKTLSVPLFGKKELLMLCAVLTNFSNWYLFIF